MRHIRICGELLRMSAGLRVRGRHSGSRKSAVVGDLHHGNRQRYKSGPFLLESSSLNVCQADWARWTNQGPPLQIWN